MTIPETLAPAPEYRPVAKKDSGLAIASLVCGIAAWVVFPFIAAIAAVVTGHLAKKEIRRSNNTIGGDGMALAGLLMGYIQLGLMLLAVIFIMMIVLLVAPGSQVFGSVSSLVGAFL